MFLWIYAVYKVLFCINLWGVNWFSNGAILWPLDLWNLDLFDKIEAGWLVRLWAETVLSSLDPLILRGVFKRLALKYGFVPCLLMIWSQRLLWSWISVDVVPLLFYYDVFFFLFHPEFILWSPWTDLGLILRLSPHDLKLILRWSWDELNLKMISRWSWDELEMKG